MLVHSFSQLYHKQGSRIGHHWDPSRRYLLCCNRLDGYTGLAVMGAAYTCLPSGPEDTGNSPGVESVVTGEIFTLSDAQHWLARRLLRCCTASLMIMNITSFTTSGLPQPKKCTINIAASRALAMLARQPMVLHLCRRHASYCIVFCTAVP